MQLDDGLREQEYLEGSGPPYMPGYFCVHWPIIIHDISQKMFKHEMFLCTDVEIVAFFMGICKMGK